MQDYSDKYEREYTARDDLRSKFIKTNELMEAKANEYQQRVIEITFEKK
jgi:hypothetical protein